jgi:hypothetical protein
MTTANPSQFSLFGALADLYPRSRRRDPETSRVAARKVLPAYRGQMARVLDAIRAHPMLTASELAAELARESGCSREETVRLRYLVSRRTADLARDGAIRRCPPRVCSVSGSPQTTWRAV